mmetsp:Transcript_34687/g.83811  ORF Transcript_34687/g.83811 Transcript_34687/m.83811 type:complete len:213 (+) Transcript_34687:563-1201(+)
MPARILMLWRSRLERGCFQMCCYLRRWCSKMEKAGAVGVAVEAAASVSSALIPMRIPSWQWFCGFPWRKNEQGRGPQRKQRAEAPRLLRRAERRRRQPQRQLRPLLRLQQLRMEQARLWLRSVRMRTWMRSYGRRYSCRCRTWEGRQHPLLKHRRRKLSHRRPRVKSRMRKRRRQRGRHCSHQARKLRLCSKMRNSLRSACLGCLGSEWTTH